MASKKDEGLLASINQTLNELVTAVGTNIDPGRIKEIMFEVDEGAHQVLKTFGQGREMIQGLKQSMTGAVDAVKLLGGGWSDILNIQDGISRDLNRNIVLSKDSYESLYATSEVAGVSAQNMVTSFKDAGISAYHASSEMGKVVNIAREIGVNAQDVSSKVLNNMDALNKYNFEGGVQGLAKMAAQASMLRIEMSQTLSFAEKVFDPEGAIETAAALQRLGVAQSDLLDPLRLMDLSQNDPAELQNQIVQMTQQFVKLNDAGNFEIMKGSKRQLREIAQAMNIPYETLTKMALGSAELEDKMKKIRFPPLTLDENQKTLIANMAEMKDGTYKIEVGGETKSVSELNEKDLDLLKKVGEPKTMEELAKDQLTTLEDIAAGINFLADKGGYVAAGSKLGTAALETGRKAGRVIPRVVPKDLSISNLTKGLNEKTKEINTVITGLGNNTMSVSTAIGSLGKILTDGGKFIEDNINKTFGNLSKEVSNVVTLDEVKDFFKNMTDAVEKRLPTNNAATTQSNIINNNDLSRGLNTNNINPTSDSIRPQEQSVVPATTPSIAPITYNNESLRNLTSNKNEVVSQDQNIKTTTDINLNHTINITAPPGVDTQQLVFDLKNDTKFKEGVITAIAAGMTNNGLTASSSNPQQRMNSFMNPKV
jgi:hypothetical protein